MINTELLVTWLAAVPTELTMVVVSGPRHPEFGRGDRLVIVTALGGIGTTLEGAGDTASFQLRLVSREHEREALQKTAFQLDTALLFGDYPADLWGTTVQHVDRSGGGPESSQEDELDRVAYVCTYIAHETPER
jgi:hypothetical protein